MDASYTRSSIKSIATRPWSGQVFRSLHFVDQPPSDDASHRRALQKLIRLLPRTLSTAESRGMRGEQHAET